MLFQMMSAVVYVKFCASKNIYIYFSFPIVSLFLPLRSVNSCFPRIALLFPASFVFHLLTQGVMAKLSVE